MAGFAIGFPLDSRAWLYTIAQADVVDLAGKTRSRRRAAQQLSDCLQSNARAGQFVSAARWANDKRAVSALA